MARVRANNASGGGGGSPQAVEMMQVAGVSNGWYVYYATDDFSNKIAIDGQMPYTGNYISASVDGSGTNYTFRAVKSGYFLVVKMDKTVSYAYYEVGDVLDTETGSAGTNKHAEIIAFV